MGIGGKEEKNPKNKRLCPQKGCVQTGITWGKNGKNTRMRQLPFIPIYFLILSGKNQVVERKGSLFAEKGRKK